MTAKEKVRAGKFLSLVLRHKPETIGLNLDKNGWVETKELLDRMNTNGFEMTLDKLKTIVSENDKKRFIFTPDCLKIRANQGHSVTVDLELIERTPPAILFHGTAERNLKSIFEKGLIKGQRHHVHLSSDSETAYKVGQRYGKPIVLIIQAAEMHAVGIKFFQSENGVWLTETVVPKFIENRNEP